MKAKINRSGCIACGLCVSTCPEVFQFASDGLAEVVADPVPEEFEDAAVECQDNCPVTVIKVE